ncbi:MAG TPA: hypothetical protein VFW19_02450 [Allosphingosinicella sp.]|nr:hypothetical protein [Allosphingosinicella sp.]
MSDSVRSDALPLDRLRDLVLADEALQAILVPLDAEALSRRLLALAGARGIAVRAADLAQLLRPDPIGISALTDPVPLRRCWPSADRLPVAMRRLPTGEAAVDWAHFGGARLGAPFFAGDVRLVEARPFNRLFRYRMRLDDFIAASAGESLPEPDGFVFHMSRCGSTLVTQMLAALPESEIVSEPAPLDVAARRAVAGAAADPVALLRATVGAFGRRGGRPFVVKLGFWQALALPLYRRAFPSVPWLFLFREPVEVLVSQLRERGPETMPLVSPIPGIDPAAPDEDQIAQALAAVCEAAADAASAGGGLFADHADLPDAVFTAILPHFGLDAEGARAAMDAAAHRDAKTPSAAFEADGAAKRAQADERLHAAAERRLGGLHRRLKALSVGTQAAAGSPREGRRPGD